MRKQTLRVSLPQDGEKQKCLSRKLKWSSPKKESRKSAVSLVDVKKRGDQARQEKCTRVLFMTVMVPTRGIRGGKDRQAGPRRCYMEEKETGRQASFRR